MCPSCLEEIEAAQHLVHCTNPTRVALKTKIVANHIKKTLKELKTRIDLMKLMLEVQYPRLTLLYWYRYYTING
jgi:hypothetical protein